jgi:hypothetical protein
MNIQPIDRQKMIAEYLDAHRAANPDKPTPVVTFSKGYFRIRDVAGAAAYENKYRKAKFRQMTTTLQSRSTPKLYAGYRKIMK